MLSSWAKKCLRKVDLPVPRAPNRKKLFVVNGFMSLWIMIHICTPIMELGQSLRCGGIKSLDHKDHEEDLKVFISVLTKIARSKASDR